MGIFGKHFKGGSELGEVPSGFVPTQKVLEGKSTFINLRVGQSNDTGFAQDSYATVGGGEWNGASLDPSTGNNTLQRVWQLLEDDDSIELIWARHAVGSTKLEDYSPGGAEHATMKLREAELIAEYGSIDLLTLFIGESDASAGTTQAAFELEIDTFLAGLAAPPLAVLAIGPPNMGTVLDEAEATISRAYQAKEYRSANFVHASLQSIMTDDDLSNNHIVRPANVELAAPLIKSALERFYK